MGLIEKTASINSIETKEYITRAIRPKYSVLNCSKIQSIYGISPSNWHDGIDSCLDSLLYDS
jgi:dTDP-4-dehydrorhamnose reductase